MPEIACPSIAVVHMLHPTIDAGDRDLAQPEINAILAGSNAGCQWSLCRNADGGAGRCQYFQSTAVSSMDVRTSGCTYHRGLVQIDRRIPGILISGLLVARCIVVVK